MQEIWENTPMSKTNFHLKFWEEDIFSKAKETKTSRTLIIILMEVEHINKKYKTRDWITGDEK